MSGLTASARRYAVGRDVFAVYAVLVVPFALGWFRTDLLTPLALPGYVAYTLGSALGNRLAPNYGLVAYWIPFLVGAYGVSVILAACGRAVRE